VGNAWETYGKVYVLRLGHRPGRDKRITTHVGLVARAFGANGFILAPICDEKVVDSLRKVLEKWGGCMRLECTDRPAGYVERWKRGGGEVIHLTMYGLPLGNVIDQVRASIRPKLVVVGAEKVPSIYYELADYNVAVGNQPHSEVAALAVFLDRLYKGAELYVTPENAGLKVIPSPSGKKVVKIGGESDAADDREDVWL
jgi:tRNA (cytidine56-2'-O)-methyltransferase